MTNAAAPQEPDSDGGERYDVFISYSRKDVEFVARLERALENYKAPASLALERRRLRVFRDAQDLRGSDYGDSIQGNLHRSARLLVICSPHARQSRYVDQEIEWYLQAHDRADVISLLLDGAPNNEVDAADPRRAFPAQLCKAHAIPLAADYRGFDVTRNMPSKPPFEGSWYTLLSNIYGIDRNTVEQRDRLRQRRERRIATAIAGVVMASLAIAAVFSWMQMRRAEEQRDLAVRGSARYLAMQSEETRSAPETALLLAAEAVRTTRDLDGTVTDDAELALRGALAEASGVRLGVGTGDVSFSPDGRWLARIEKNGAVTVWDLSAPASQPASVTLPKAELGGLRFGPAHQIAVITSDRTRVALLDVRDLSLPPRWLAPRAGLIQDLQFSPDGATLMMVDQGPDIVLADLADAAGSPMLLQGHAVRRIAEDSYGIRAATFSATGRWVASTGWDDTVRLWDRNAKSAASQLVLADVSADKPRFSPDDRWLLVTLERAGESQSVPYALWCLDGPVPKPVTMDSGEVSGDAFGDPMITGPTAFTPLPFASGDRLIMAGAHETFLWKLDPAGARIERRIPDALAALRGDGRHFATVSVRNGTQPLRVISLWDVESPEADGEVEVTSSIEGLAYAADGRRLVALTDDGELWSWHLEERDFESNPDRYRGAIGNSLLMSADGRAAVIGYWYGDSRLWDLANPSLDPIRLRDIDVDAELELKTSTSGMSGKPAGGLQQMLAFDDQSDRVAVPRNGGVVAVVNLEYPNRTPATISVQEDGVSAIAFSPDGGTVAAGDRELTIRLWHAGETGKPFATLRVPSAEGSASSISALAFSHSGKLLAAGGAFGTVAVWDLSTPGEEPLTLTSHEDWVTTVAFSADDRSLLIAAADGKASIVTLDKPPAVRLLEGHVGVIRAAFTAGDQFVVTAGMDATIRVWSMRDAAAEPRILRGHSGPITTFALVPHKQLLVTASDDGSLRVWDLAAVDQPERIITLQTQVNVMAVSHDGSWLALGGLGGGVEIRRMDALDQAPMRLPAAAPPRQDDAEVWALQFSPDDRWLAALTPGQGRLWRLRVDELMQLACDATGRNLDIEDWERYLNDLQYRFTCPGWELGPHYLEYARREAERGSFENAVRLLKRAKALVPGLPFEPVAEATRVSVEGVLDRGRSLARQGQPDAALAEFGRVRQIDPGSSFDPAREMENVKRAGELIPQAEKQAYAGELEPAIAKYREALKLDPGLGIDPVSEANKIYAPVLVEQGRALAAEGRMEEAVVLLERAVLLDPKAVWESPEAAARNARAHALARQAAKLADEGELQAAIAGYRAALAVDERLGIDPEAEARKRVAVHWMDEAYSRLSEANARSQYEELLGAIERFEQARKLDPAVYVRAYSANDLCWAAVQHGYAKQALGVCNAAVASDDDSWMARDSRGVARVLVGDTAGAIEDFEFYVRASDGHDSVEQRKRWIVRLKAGWRPQSFAELDSE